MPNDKPVSTSWKPGESGNPNGRPKKGYSITEWFQEMFKAQPEVKDALAKSIVKKALEGDIAAQKLVWNYMDGMPQQKTDITSGGKPIPILGGISQDALSSNNSNTQTPETTQEN